MIIFIKCVLKIKSDREIFVARFVDAKVWRGEKIKMQMFDEK